MRGCCSGCPTVVCLSVGGGVFEDEGWDGCLVEVEGFGQVAQEGIVFPDPGASIRAAVGGRIQALAVQEIVLDELDIGVVA